MDCYNKYSSCSSNFPYDPCCCCCPEPEPTPPPSVTASFTAIKRDQATGEAIPRAAYTLFQNGQPISSTVSDASGSVSFASLTPGKYELIERMVPNGYQMDTTTHVVIVDANGNVTIDGQNAEGFALYDISISQSGNLTFSKTDAATGLPLAGAEFTLSNGAANTSDGNGIVDFGSLTPGVYTMTETAVPSGYEPNNTSYTVEVANDGRITVNGMPIEQFAVANNQSTIVSSRPTINSVAEGDTSITGEGIPGATIAVTLPNGSQVSTTVNTNGTWLVQIPTEVTLQTGQTLYANQTVAGYAPSENVSFLVQPRI